MQGGRGGRRGPEHMGNPGQRCTSWTVGRCVDGSGSVT